MSEASISFGANGRVRPAGAADRRVPPVFVELRADRRSRPAGRVRPGSRQRVDVAASDAGPQPELRAGRDHRRPRRRRHAAPRRGPHLPHRQKRERHPRQQAHAAPTPGRGGQGRAGRPQLSADHGHRVGQEPGLHHPHRGPRPAHRLRPGPQGRRGVPDERPGQQPDGGAGQVPGPRPVGREPAGDLPALHRPGPRRGPGGDPGRAPRHLADQLRDAGADPHPGVRPQAEGAVREPALPGARRAAHLPGPPGLRRGHAGAPGPPGRGPGRPGEQPAAAVRGNVGHPVEPGQPRRATGPSRRRGLGAVRRRSCA